MRLYEYIEQHLKDRGINLKNQLKYPVYIDKEKDVAYFPLFNLSGKFVGYQRYNPKGGKGKDSYKLSKNDKKYYTYATKENPEKKVSSIVLYGLHTLDKRPYVFVVEGIFDAVKLIKLNEPVVAVLSNDPKKLKNFFFILQKKVIAICDSDDNKAGNKLKRIANKCYFTPSPYKDLGDMPNKEVKSFIKSIKI